MSFILDASVTLSWCFSDEMTPAAVSLLKKLEHEEACVPEIWALEVGNILIMAEKKKRISYANMMEFISLLTELNIRTDKETSVKGLHEILLVAHANHLTTYDAAYLELALRTGFPLASKDQHLCKVAKSLGVKTL